MKRTTIKFFAILAVVSILPLAGVANYYESWAHNGDRMTESSNPDAWLSYETWTHKGELAPLFTSLSSVEGLDTWIKVLNVSDITEELNSESRVTIFAPTNAAFAALPDGTVDRLLAPENVNEREAFIHRHIIPAQINSADLVYAGSLLTDGGERVIVHVDLEGVSINGGTVETFDITASNGYIHTVSSVIQPAK